jgi:diguanylate cyclase (GGDEF)-like protein
MIDMDGLKYINDRFGHAHGDTGILAITEAIRAVSGEEDIAVRAGGDEFVLIAAGNLTEADGQARADQIGRILAERNAAQPGQPYEITASIGFVCFPAAEPDVLDEQMREADRRMYDHKTARKKQRRS